MKVPRIKAERLRRSWRQIELSYFCGVSVSDISKIKTGRMRPYRLHAERIGKVLGLEPAEIVEMVDLEEIPSTG